MPAIPKSDWKAFCNRVSKGLEGKRAEIAVASLRLGAQVEGEWLPLLGIAYDDKDDLFEVALEGLDHLVNRPREVHAQEGATGLESLLVRDADGTQHLVRFKEPVMIAPPGA
jgi:hypothetical protein